ncbi:MAG: hypothetical protein ACLRWM_05530 [Streptococcus sp.]
MKSYQLAGYTPYYSKQKFKNITMSLKLEGKLTKKMLLNVLYWLLAYWRNRKLSSTQHYQLIWKIFME